MANEHHFEVPFRTCATMHVHRLPFCMHIKAPLLCRQLTPKGPSVFLLKIASKQPFLKASQIMQN
jgi:hypothetical protein